MCFLPFCGGTTTGACLQYGVVLPCVLGVVSLQQTTAHSGTRTGKLSHVEVCEAQLRLKNWTFSHKKGLRMFSGDLLLLEPNVFIIREKHQDQLVLINPAWILVRNGNPSINKRIISLSFEKEGNNNLPVEHVVTGLHITAVETSKWSNGLFWAKRFPVSIL